MRVFKLKSVAVMLKKICTVLATAIALTACVTSPTGRSQLILLPDSQVNQMGLQAFETLKRDKPISNNTRLNQVANCIAWNLTQGIGGTWGPAGATPPVSCLYLHGPHRRGNGRSALPVCTKPQSKNFGMAGFFQGHFADQRPENDGPNRN